jgi:hypothetical protein
MVRVALLLLIATGWSCSSRRAPPAAQTSATGTLPAAAGTGRIPAASLDSAGGTNVSSGEGQLERDVPHEFDVLATSTQIVEFSQWANGKVAPQYFAFRQLLRHPRAEQWFTRLIESSYYTGRLYGLCGLKRLNSGQFERQAARLSGMTATVEVAHSYDTSTISTVSEVVATFADVCRRM